MIERPLLDVTNQLIRKAEGHADSTGNLFLLTERTLKTIGRQQPNLHAILTQVNSLEGIGDTLALLMGETLTYDMIPRSEKRRSLTAGQVAASYRSIVDDTLFEDKEDSIFRISSLIEKLRRASPLFIDWLEETVGLLDDHDRNYFTLGSLLVALPFFQRNEARQMERNLFK